MSDKTVGFILYSRDPFNPDVLNEYMVFHQESFSEQKMEEKLVTYRKAYSQNSIFGYKAFKVDLETLSASLIEEQYKPPKTVRILNPEKRQQPLPEASQIFTQAVATLHSMNLHAPTWLNNPFFTEEFTEVDTNGSF